VIKIKVNSEVTLVIRGIGIRSVISTSKIKKITAIRKNCREKGAREKNRGENPHSKDDSFSRSLNDLVAIEELRPIKINAINMAVRRIIIITFFIRAFKLEV